MATPHLSSLTVLDLCAGSGAWSDPYLDAGYNVIRVELTDGVDVRNYTPPHEVHGILAAPPCTYFSYARNQWPLTSEQWREARDIVNACLQIILDARPAWWAMENPTDKLRKLIGPPRYNFHPYHHGDHYTKSTDLWGDFTIPTRHPVPPYLGSRMHTKVRDPAQRAITPAGFARDFFTANP